jgi:hypothetical protein
MAGPELVRQAPSGLGNNLQTPDHGIKMQIVILERGVGHAGNEALRRGDVVPNVVRP